MLPAVGPLFPAVVALFYPLWVRSIRCSRLFVTTLLVELFPLPRVVACECVCHAPRAPNSHHPCNARPWFRQGLGCLDELLDLSRADPRAPLRMLTHPLLLRKHLRMLCVVCWIDQHHSQPYPGSVRGGPCFQSLVAPARRNSFRVRSCSVPQCGRDRALRSASASGVHSRRSSVVATLRSCRRCDWLCASWSVAALDADMLVMIDRSACLVELVLVVSRGRAGRSEHVHRRVRSLLSSRGFVSN